MKRAAWLDHEIQWVKEPSMFELERLGLMNNDVILITDQVDLLHDGKGGAASIIVKEIDIVSIDEESRQMSYRIRGQNVINQLWSFGGANLSSVKDRHEPV
jgi:hypothetical protein